MKNIELDKIKDTVYELEGLLELARLREDKTEELLPLMKSRLDELNRLFKTGSSAEDPAGQSAERVRENVDAAPEEKSESQETIEENTGDEEVYSLPDTPEDYSVASDDTAFSGISGYGESTEIPENTMLYDASGSTSESTETPKSAPRPAFCINDRFRFRRELFNNSDAEFSSAMDLVATMDNYEEAEEYFIGDLGWNEENEDVVAFLDIIRQYFEK